MPEINDIEQLKSIAFSSGSSVTIMVRPEVIRQLFLEIEKMRDKAKALHRTIPLIYQKGIDKGIKKARENQE